MIPVPRHPVPQIPLQGGGGGTINKGLWDAQFGDVR